MCSHVRLAQQWHTGDTRTCGTTGLGRHARARGSCAQQRMATASVFSSPRASTCGLQRIALVGPNWCDGSFVRARLPARRIPELHSLWKATVVTFGTLASQPRCQSCARPWENRQPPVCAGQGRLGAQRRPRRSLATATAPVVAVASLVRLGAPGMPTGSSSCSTRPTSAISSPSPSSSPLCRGWRSSLRSHRPAPRSGVPRARRPVLSLRALLLREARGGGQGAAAEEPAGVARQRGRLLGHHPLREPRPPALRETCPPGGAHSAGSQSVFGSR